MKKIILHLDALRVESFVTAAEPADRRGTVRAAEGTAPTDCLAPSCGPPCEPTFADSCWGTCIDETCDPACPPMSLDTCLSCLDC